MEHKYVRHSVIGFVLWPRCGELWHSRVGSMLPKFGVIESAGFAKMSNGKMVCWGFSESLNIASKADDSEALTKQLGLHK